MSVDVARYIPASDTVMCVHACPCVRCNCVTERSGEKIGGVPVKISTILVLEYSVDHTVTLLVLEYSVDHTVTRAQQHQVCTSSLEWPACNVR